MKDKKAAKILIKRAKAKPKFIYRYGSEIRKTN